MFWKLTFRNLSAYYLIVSSLMVAIFITIGFDPKHLYTIPLLSLQFAMISAAFKIDVLQFLVKVMYIPD